jgi:hypothetical protein
MRNLNGELKPEFPIAEIQSSSVSKPYQPLTDQLCGKVLHQAAKPLE